jgi:hypothetical protein
MAVQYLSTILDHFDTKLATITSAASGAAFEAIDYRYPMDKQPTGAVQGKYALRAPAPKPERAEYGTGEVFRSVELAVELGYVQGGGDANDGDARSVMELATTDAVNLSDTIENPNNDGYNRDVTGIREINFLGAEMVRQAGEIVIWVARFRVIWRSDVYAP